MSGVVIEAAEPEIQLHRWTRLEYESLVDAGIIEEGSRKELLDGVIIEMPVQKPRHANCCDNVEDALRKCFGATYRVRSQKPIALDDFSEPEPDISVFERDQLGDLKTEHPSDAILLVEVSDSSLSKDRNAKLRAYARNAIPEYWILNLVDDQLEVYREPTGERYAKTMILKPGDSVTPLTHPEETIEVADFMN